MDIASDVKIRGSYLLWELFAVLFVTVSIYYGARNMNHVCTSMDWSERGVERAVQHCCILLHTFLGQSLLFLPSG
jgi:hypothetical protein